MSTDSLSPKEKVFSIPLLLQQITQSNHSCKLCVPYKTQSYFLFKDSEDYRAREASSHYLPFILVSKHWASVVVPLLWSDHARVGDIENIHPFTKNSNTMPSSSEWVCLTPFRLPILKLIGYSSARKHRERVFVITSRWSEGYDLRQAFRKVPSNASSLRKYSVHPSIIQPLSAFRTSAQFRFQGASSTSIITMKLVMSVLVEKGSSHSFYKHQ